MKIAVAADHRGYEAKRKLIPMLRQFGHDVIDFGCEDGSACDYPDLALLVATAVVDGRAAVGILLDNSGIGMSVAANKVHGIRAGLVHDEVTARLAREANHCNVLCLGTDLISEHHMWKIAQVFLTTPYGPGRHARRVAKVMQIEGNHHPAPHPVHPAHATLVAKSQAPASVSTPLV